MKHDKIKKLMPLYIDSGLNSKEKEIVDNHLKSCEECRQLLAKYRENHEMLINMETHKTPENFLDNTISKIKNIEKENSKQNQNDSKLINRVKAFFKKPIRMPAGILTAGILLILITVLVLPQFNQSQDTNNISFDYGSGQMQTMQLDAESSISRSAVPTAKSNPAALDSSSDERKIIKTANLTIEIDSIEGIDPQVTALISEYQGYIASSRTWIVNDIQHHSMYNLRVPADYFEEFIERLAVLNEGEEVSRSISGRDVTEEYSDLSIQLDNLKAQQESYRRLLDKAESVEDILKIENELNQVRTSIERLQGRLNYLDNQTDYSTINVEFREKYIDNAVVDFLQDIGDKILDNTNKIINFTAAFLPYLLLILLAYLIYRKKKNS